MTRHRVLILGAGGFGRETLQWCRDAGLDSGDSWVAGFLDDDPDALGEVREGVPPILGSIRDYRPQAGDWLVCGVAIPPVKRSCVTALVDRGAQFKTVIHPTALVGRNVRLGQGCVVCPGVILTADIEVGRFVTLNCYSSVGHDGRLGEWATLSPYACVNGRAGVGEGGMLGTHAVVLPGVRVGEWATLGAGSVACQAVPPSVTGFGVPAKPIWTASRVAPGAGLATDESGQPADRMRG